MADGQNHQSPKLQAMRAHPKGRTLHTRDSVNGKDPLVFIIEDSFVAESSEGYANAPSQGRLPLVPLILLACSSTVSAESAAGHRVPGCSIALQEKSSGAGVALPLHATLQRDEHGGQRRGAHS